MFRVLFALLACVLVTASALAAEPQGRRVALVIGNSDYRHAPKLPNPANDANDMADALEKLGFEVVRGTNLDLDAMRARLRRFVDKLDGAKVALFFYAGHGLQVDGKNYLLPIDIRVRSQADLDFAAVDVDLVLRNMEREPRTNIVFLDACRDNPLASDLASRMGARSLAVGRGLAQVDGGVGTLIGFSTQPGNYALDGEGRNSPYTTALLHAISTPGLSLGDLMIEVRNEVLKATDGKQIPWEHSSLTGQFYFIPPTAPPAGSGGDTDAIEIAYWNSIKDMKNPKLFKAYLDRYPSGAFASIAKIDMEQLASVAATPMNTASGAERTLARAADVHELEDRLYELNFDPAPRDLAPAIRDFEQESRLEPTGRATVGLLTRLRSLGGLTPWGSIVYDAKGGHWGIAWNETTRKAAVAAAHQRCGTTACTAEISFFGTSCGAFAASPVGWSIVARGAVGAAKQVALDQCGRRGGGCRIVAAACADGADQTIARDK